jgi:hypothetical protein
MKRSEPDWHPIPRFIRDSPESLSVTSRLFRASRRSQLLDSFAALPSRSPLPRGYAVHLVVPNSSIHSLLSRAALRCLAAMQCISSFPTPRLSAEVAIDKIDIMKFTKNIGMLLLAVYLIIDGLLGFGLNIGPAIFLLYIVALAAGVFILIGK